MNDAARDFRRAKEQYPEVNPTWVNFKFPGRGQKNTPVADVRGIVESGRTKNCKSHLSLFFCLKARRVCGQALSRLGDSIFGDLPPHSAPR